MAKRLVKRFPINEEDQTVDCEAFCKLADLTADNLALISQCLITKTTKLRLQTLLSVEMRILTTIKRNERRDYEVKFNEAMILLVFDYGHRNPHTSISKIRYIYYQTHKSVFMDRFNEPFEKMSQPPHEMASWLHFACDDLYEILEYPRSWEADEKYFELVRRLVIYNVRPVDSYIDVCNILPHYASCLGMSKHLTKTKSQRQNYKKIPSQSRINPL